LTRPRCLAATFNPASRYQVGGDFYDVFPIDNQTWGLSIGDVCGKGPEAAGRTSCARYSMRTAAIHETEPSRVLAVVNKALLVDAEPSSSTPPPVCLPGPGPFGRFLLTTVGVGFVAFGLFATLQSRYRPT
jgi:Stage II sporulation protein E (SpoIIE)